jgi:hypothetical protein
MNLWVSRGFLIGLSVKTAFLREVDTAGTSVPITSGEDGNRDEYCP